MKWTSTFCYLFLICCSSLWASSDALVELLVTRDPSDGLVKESALRSVIDDETVLELAIARLRKKGHKVNADNAYDLEQFHLGLYDFIKDQGRGPSNDFFQPTLMIGLSHDSNITTQPFGEWADGDDSSLAQTWDLRLNMVGREAPWGLWSGFIAFDGHVLESDQVSSFEDRNVSFGFGSAYESGVHWQMSQAFSFGGLNGVGELGATQSKLELGYLGSEPLDWRGLWDWSLGMWIQHDRFEDLPLVGLNDEDRTQVGLSGHLDTHWAIRDHRWELGLDHAWFISDGDDVLDYVAVDTRVSLSHRHVRSRYVTDLVLDYQTRFDQERSGANSDEDLWETYVRVHRALWSERVRGWVQLGMSHLGSEIDGFGGQNEQILAGMKWVW